MTQRFWENLPTGEELIWGRNPFLHRKDVPTTLPKALLPQHRDDLIRLGTNRDGGYVLTRRILDAADFLVSAGLGYEWSFEAAFATYKKIGAGRCCFHGYDPTIIDEKKLAKIHRRASWRRFYNKHYKSQYILQSNYKDFFGGSPGQHISKWLGIIDNTETLTLDTAIDNALATGASKVLVKVDIEEAEYDVLPTLSNTSKVAGLICEFHDLNQRVTDLLAIVEQLKQDFYLVHTTACNWPGPRELKFPNAMELTFEHKSLSEEGSKSKHRYPIAGLDFRNIWNRETYLLEFETE